MEITLTPGASVMLTRMLYNPQSLTEDKPYQAADPIAQQEVVSISKWLQNKVLEKSPMQSGEEQVRFKTWTGKVKEHYIKRLKAIAEHYKKSGQSIQNCESYVELMNGLDGKPQTVEEVEEA